MIDFNEQLLFVFSKNKCVRKYIKKTIVVKGFELDAAANVIKAIRKSIITVEEHFDLLLHTKFIKKTLDGK